MRERERGFSKFWFRWHHPVCCSGLEGLLLFWAWLSFSTSDSLSLFPFFLHLSSFLSPFTQRGREREMASLPDGKKLISKHQNLKQDYDDLLRETQGLNARVQEAKERRSRLLAEVRFLQRRHKILSSNPMSENPKQRICQSQNLDTPSGSDRWRKSSKEDGPPRRNSALLDLNQASEPKMEQDEEVQVVLEPVKLKRKAKVGVIEDDPLMSDLKLSICREINNAIVGGGGGAERVGKRKISRQDQVDLRV